MAQKRELDFESIYGGITVDDEEMEIGSKDKLMKNEELNDDLKLKDGKELKADVEMEINGKGYHITF